MSEQSQTTTNAPADPVLCKMGCGFFGSNATGDCCSKCWRQLNGGREKKDGAETTPQPLEGSSSQADETVAADEQKPTPMDVEPQTPASAPQEPIAESPAKKAASSSTPKKRKKKKATYKNMMAGMMQGGEGASPRDIEKEKQDIKKVTGGGTFSKVEKI